MSDDYGLDNAGSGFAVDADADVDALLNEAAEYEEKDDYNLETDLDMSSDSHRTEQPAEPAPEPTPEPVAYEEEPSKLEANNDGFARPEPTYEPEPVSEQPTYREPEPAARVTPPTRLSSRQSQVNYVQQTISLLGEYRSLTTTQQETALQLMGFTSIAADDEAEVVVSIMGVEPMRQRVMNALTTAKSLEPVERAFFIIECPPDLLYGLGSLVSAISDFAPPSQNAVERTKYARALVKGIEELDNSIVTYVELTEKLLKALDVKDD